MLALPVRVSCSRMTARRRFLFCRDLAHYAAGEPLEHLVDWAKGY